MPTSNSRKGSETERMVAKYLRDQGFPRADRRLREGRQDDCGDIDGVPYTTIQVKYVAANRYQEWVTDTLRQRDEAGTPLCLLIRRVPRKSVEEWEALMPLAQIYGEQIFGEGMSQGWVRMDLSLAMAIIRRKVASLWDPSSPTTSEIHGIGSVHVTKGSFSAPSTESPTPPFPTP
jgi:hypothetical protein